MEGWLCFCIQYELSSILSICSPLQSLWEKTGVQSGGPGKRMEAMKDDTNESKAVIARPTEMVTASVRICPHFSVIADHLPKSVLLLRQNYVHALFSNTVLTNSSNLLAKLGFGHKKKKRISKLISQVYYPTTDTSLL